MAAGPTAGTAVEEVPETALGHPAVGSNSMMELPSDHHHPLRGIRIHQWMRQMAVAFHEPIRLLLSQELSLPRDSHLLHITDQYQRLKVWIDMRTNLLLRPTMTELTNRLRLHHLTMLVLLVRLVARV